MSVKDRLSKLEKEQLKQWYIDGMPVSDICTALGISRDAFYYHKNKFAKQGIDLEELRLANLRSKKNLEQKETEFLNTLIIAFESGIKEIEKIEDPAQKLEVLAKYVNTYYKLKAPKEIDCRQQVIEAISRTIYEISQLAIDKEEHDVVQFLHKYSNEIIERTMRIRK